MSNGLRCRIMRKTILWSLLAAICSLGQVVEAAALQGKYHPGNYIAINRGDSVTTTIGAARAGVVGFQQRYYWAELEPNYGVYDFSLIQADLDTARSQGRQLVVLITDKSFTNVKPLPAYAQGDAYMMANRAGGFTALRWKTNVTGRFKLLIKAIGKRFDSDPAFEGIAFTETSLSLNRTDLDAHGYTPEAYRDAIIDVLLTSAAAMPNSRVFWYMNFLVRNQSYLGQIAAAVAPAGIIMGGPDVLPDQSELVNMTYPLYDQFQGKMPLFNSLQEDSYSHDHKKAGYSTKYWTMSELFNYAKNDLHVNYLFWSRKQAVSPYDSYTINDAYPVIERNPTINTNWSGTGTTGLDSDGDGLSDSRESNLGTDPSNPDTDSDLLKDGAEVTLGTKPLKKDSDWDGLIDGNEVSLGTNPLKADTDNGGVNDKLEVERGTNPLKAWDD